MDSDRAGKHIVYFYNLLKSQWSMFPPMLLLLISFWWISDEILLLLFGGGTTLVCRRRQKKTDFFFPHRASLTNNLSVLNESRSDHLILIGWAAARVVFHGPQSDSEKMESGPAKKKWTAKQSDGGTKVHLSSVAINVKSHEEMMALIKSECVKTGSMCVCVCLWYRRRQH